MTSSPCLARFTAPGPWCAASLRALALSLALLVAPAMTALARADAGMPVTDACGPDASVSAHIDPQRAAALHDPIAVPVERLHAVCTASPHAASGEPLAWLAILGAMLVDRAVRRSSRRRGSRAGAQRRTV